MKHQDIPWLIESGIHGDTAVCHLPESHPGACAMRYSGRSDDEWAIFPNIEQGISAASAACRYDIGGYADVRVLPFEEAPVGAPAFETAMQWLFGDDEEPDTHPARSADQIGEISKGLSSARVVVDAAWNAGIGHNRPPEPIEVPPIFVEEIDAVINIANVYRAQLACGDPDEEVVLACESLFAAFGRRLGLFVTWLKHLPENMFKAVVDKTPEWMAKAGVVAILLELADLLLPNGLFPR